MLVTWILAWLHVVSAIGWLGGGILFAFVVGPALARLSPPSAGEFLLKVVPRVARFFQVAGVLTVVFGGLLLFNIGGLGLLSLSTSYGVDLSIGVGFALAAFVVAEFGAVPIQLGAVKMIREMVAAGGTQPPLSFPRQMRLARMSAALTVTLLLGASVFMVGAGFY